MSEPGFLREHGRSLALGVAAALLLTFGYLFGADLTRHKGAIEARISAAIGEPARLDGPLRLVLDGVGRIRLKATRLTLGVNEIKLDDVGLSGPMTLIWHSASPMTGLSAARVTIENGERASAILETALLRSRGDGRALRRIEIGALHMPYLDEPIPGLRRLDIEAIVVRRDGGEATFRAKLPLAGDLVEVGGVLGPLATFPPTDPVGLRWQARAGDLVLTFDGRLMPDAERLMGGALALKAPGGRAFHAVGLSALAPIDGPVAATAEFSLGRGLIALDGIDARFARSDLAGEVTLNVDSRVTLLGTLAGRVLDLTPFLSAEEAGAPRRFVLPEPQTDFTLTFADGWQAAGGQFTVSYDTVLLDRAVASDVTIAGLLADGILTLNPMAATFGGGRIRAESQINLAGAPDFSLALLADNVDVAPLLGPEPIDEASRTPGGTRLPLHLGISLTAKGAARADLLTTLDGDVQLLSDGGWLAWSSLANRLPVLAEQLQALGETAQAGEELRLRCVAAQFRLGGGRIASRLLVAKTARTSLTGDARMGLTTGSLDVLLVPRPHDPMRIDLARDIQVHGSWGAPVMVLSSGAEVQGVAGSLGVLDLTADGRPLLALLKPTHVADNACLRGTGNASAFLPKGKSAGDLVDRIFPRKSVQEGGFAAPGPTPTISRTD